MSNRARRGSTRSRRIRRTLLCDVLIHGVLAAIVLAGCRLGFDPVGGSGVDASEPTGNTSVRDGFSALAYDNNDGTQPWATSWIEVGDDGSPMITGTSTIFIESHDQNPTPFDLALKVRVPASGQYIYRAVDLSGATAPRLSYRFRNELVTPGRVDMEISADGNSWITLKTYTDGDIYGSEMFDIADHATATTQIRFIALAAGGRHLRIDDVEIVFTR